MKRMNKDTCADVSLLRAGVLFPTPETADGAEFDFILSHSPKQQTAQSSIFYPTAP